MAKSPAFQYYPDNFEQGTATFTLAEVGGYQRLLNYQWTNGSVPGDSVKSLSQIMRCTPATAKSVWSQIACKFVKHEDGQWRNAKMESVRAEQDGFRASQSRNAAVRWQAKRTAEPMPSHMPTACSPSPSPPPSPSPKEAEAEPAAAPPTRPALQGRGALEANSLQRDHLRHVICGPEFRFCLSDRLYGILAPIFNDAPDVTKRELTRWVAEMEATTLAPGKSAGDIKWLLGHFNAWVVSLGRVPDAPATVAASSSRLAAIDRWGT